jgi:hypothetical protein
MQDVKELRRNPSPAGRPQPLAFYGKTLWMGSWDTDKLYAIDTQSWKVTDEVAAPGKPYGLTAFGDELRVVVSIGADDDRYLYRFVPGKGFDANSKMACPDFTGSHLASDGTTIYLGQMGLKRILALDEDGAIQREIALPTRCGGFGFGAGAFYMISTDEEWENVKFAKLDIAAAAPQAVPIAAIPFEGARALAYDGAAWWTSDREVNEIVVFTA